MSSDDFDREGFEDFLNESRDLLADLQPALLDLENSPGDLDLVEEPFRILHSIKGMSSFFGLTPIKRISHALEDLLTEIREERLAVNEDVLDVLFEGSERLNDFYDEVFAGNRNIELGEEDEAFLSRVRETQEQTAGYEEKFSDFVADLEEITARLLDDLGDHPDVRELSGRIERARERLDRDEADDGEGEQGYSDSIFSGSESLGGIEVGEFFTTLEAICRRTLAEEDDLDEETVEEFEETFRDLHERAREQEWTEVVEVFDEMRREFDRFMETAGFGELLGDSFLKHLSGLESDLNYETAEDENGTESGQSPDVSRTFRVEEQKVDDFMEYVGELIVTGEMYQHFQEELQSRSFDSELLDQLRSTNQAFRDLSNDLQESLLSIRKLPINDLLKKFPVMVRQLRSETEKDVDMTLVGEDAMVDKIFVEKLESPLTHLVRNAVDHGIEPPEQREEAGKDPAGSIEIEVIEQEERLLIEVRDDGRGLDADEIRGKVLEKGLATEEELEEQEDDRILEYIFESGFSTNEDVTDVSGRGVGMNAVRTTVEELNGDVRIDSEPGEGTTFVLELPRAQSINVLESLVLEVDGQQFGVPLEQVLESVSIDNAQLKTVEGRGEMIEVRDELHSLYRLRDVFELSAGKPDRPIALLLRSENGDFAVLADRILEQQKVVVKEMGPVFQGIEFADGAAVMGDGNLCLVLDLNGLAREVHRETVS